MSFLNTTMMAAGLVLICGAANAMPRLICFKPTPGAPSLCGVVSSYFQSPQTFEGWVPVPSAMSDGLVAQIGDDCSARLDCWNASASAGNSIRIHFDRVFEETE
jgi:hypothetical protein